jgi:hypothetical protein
MILPKEEDDDPMEQCCLNAAASTTNFEKTWVGLCNYLAPTPNCQKKTRIQELANVVSYVSIAYTIGQYSIALLPTRREIRVLSQT